MLELRLLRRLQLGNDLLREHLPELDAPLIEGVDPPDRALGEDAVLVEGDQRAERVRGEPLGEDHVRGPVPLHHPVRDDRLGRPLLPDLLGRLAEGERLGLCEDVRHQQVVVVAERIERVHEADEVAGDQARPLVDQLVEGVLAVGPRLAPVDRAGVVVDPGAVEGDVLAVRLHGELLEVGREAVQVLVVGEDRRRSARRRSRRTRPRAGRGSRAGSRRSAAP